MHFIPDISDLCYTFNNTVSFCKDLLILLIHPTHDFPFHLLLKFLFSIQLISTQIFIIYFFPVLGLICFPTYFFQVKAFRLLILDNSILYISSQIVFLYPMHFEFTLSFIFNSRHFKFSLDHLLFGGDCQNLGGHLI